ncbi:uncharacterized protein LOC132758699 [Ruditapes philippinarum]|uniref:uncharacterized protein LOC132758699 n=1 Tax=Ruditapes philippinarum TaxID=129788 RepID=UPI00295A8627|nr:uncharacterized protein LOC132758699 [Ruditapes philippinarum]
MAAGNIFKYTFLSIFIFCGTKMLYLVKESSENYSKQLPVDDNDYFNTFKEQNFPVLHKDSNKVKNKPGLIQMAIQQRNFKKDVEVISKINSTMLTNNNLKRKRKLLSEMWDTYYKVKESVTLGKQVQRLHAFHQVGNDTFVYSVFYDDRQISKNKNPVLQIVTISKLQSKSTLMCKFSESSREDGQWVTAVKQELSDNHGKIYGGVLYTCNIPNILHKTPQKTIHLQSQITQDDNLSKVTSALVTMEVIWLEMSNWKSAIYHDADNLQKSQSVKQHINSANNFLETFPNSKESRKNQTIDKSQISSPEIIQGRQLDLAMKEKYKELSRTRNNSLPTVSICVPPLFGDIKLSEFIQFVEIHRILGASQIFFYKMDVTSDIGQMLNYYHSQGLVSLHDWILPKELQVSENIWYNGQSAAQQDCLYRNMGKYDYTAFIDLDEVIVPTSASDWPQMLEQLDKTYTEGKNRHAAAYIFKSAFFEPNYTNTEKTNIKHEKLSFLRSLYRTEKISSIRNKVIVKPVFIEFTGIHHVSKLVNSELNPEIVNVPVNKALIHHYRKCTEALDTEMHCGKYVADANLLKHSETLLKNYERALDDNIKYFKTIK